MAKNAFTDWSTTAADNTDIAGIALSDQTRPTDLDDIAREMMAQLRAGVPVLAETARLNQAQTWTAAQEFAGGIKPTSIELGSNVDLNTCTTPGLYTANGNGQTNGPWGATALFLWVQRRAGGSGNFIRQIAWPQNGNGTAARYSTDGGATWGSWVENWDTGNDSALVKTSGAQTIAGNKTFTGILNIQGSNPQIHLTDTDGINWAIVSNNNTDLLIGVDRDNSGTIEAPHPLLLESDNNRGLLFGNPIASVYTGSSANETNFPIGTTLLVALATSGDTLPARNSVVTIRLNPGNSAQYIWGSSATGTVLQGTWRNRGSLVQGGALLMERVA